MKRFRDALDEGFVFTMEVTPPKGTNLARVFAEVAKCKGKAAAINVTDCPLGRLKMSSISAASIIKGRSQIDTIFNLTCRDRTVMGLQADLLGAHALGLENVLALTGDSAAEGQGGVFQVDALGLVKLLAGLNRGNDARGRELEGKTSFFIGVAANSGAPNLEKELSRVEAKIREGANFILTQPSYDAKRAGAFLKAAAGLGVPILLGLMPLKNLSLAEYLNRSVPGIEVPPDIISRLAQADGEGQRQIGAAIALELFEETGQDCQGFHIMPVGDLELACQVLDEIARRV